MATVASRELRNQTRALLDRVSAGERITITVDGRSVAELVPVAERSAWMRRDRFARELLSRQADPQLAAELLAISSETTDDLPSL